MSRKSKKYSWLLDQRDYLYAAPQALLAKLPKKLICVPNILSSSVRALGS
jgi:hypothetical protein